MKKLLSIVVLLSLLIIGCSKENLEAVEPLESIEFIEPTGVTITLGSSGNRFMADYPNVDSLQVKASIVIMLNNDTVTNEVVTGIVKADYTKTFIFFKKDFSNIASNDTIKVWTYTYTGQVQLGYNSRYYINNKQISSKCSHSISFNKWNWLIFWKTDDLGGFEHRYSKIY
jgi:hypothetical protein